jgi:tetratricopeptide (TPR) repeat protein
MGKRKLKLTKKQVLVGVGIVVLLAAAVGTGFLVRWLQTKDGGLTEQSPQKELPEAVTKTEDLLANGKTDEASKHIEESLKNQSLPSEEKYILYLQQGNIEVEKKNYSAALQAYTSASQAMDTFIAASKIASLYQLQGNKEKAIEYYKKAISLNTDPKNPVREDENRMFGELITTLENQQ